MRRVYALHFFLTPLPDKGFGDVVFLGQLKTLRLYSVDGFDPIE